MKNILFLTLLTLLWTSCEKNPVEQVQEDALAKAMSTGKWSISSYTIDNNNMTSEFAGYEFQFQTNYTVDAIKNGNVEKTGTWQSNTATLTITSNFVNANHPLPLLNGTWTVTSASDAFVESNQTINGVTHKLRLQKV